MWHENKIDIVVSDLEKGQRLRNLLLRFLRSIFGDLHGRLCGLLHLLLSLSLLIGRRGNFDRGLLRNVRYGIHVIQVTFVVVLPQSGPFDEQKPPPGFEHAGGLVDGFFPVHPHVFHLRPGAQRHDDVDRLVRRGGQVVGALVGIFELAVEIPPRGELLFHHALDSERQSAVGDEGGRDDLFDRLRHVDDHPAVLGTDLETYFGRSRRLVRQQCGRNEVRTERGR
mmetsp:Transcript_16064/g.36132  ORF Transcript_16064/g.36132 Transcript_16064/m.36132 type:complete len:225 (+) Transcript_16064:309-983(+)